MAARPGSTQNPHQVRAGDPRLRLFHQTPTYRSSRWIPKTHQPTTNHVQSKPLHHHRELQRRVPREMKSIAQPSFVDITYVSTPLQQAEQHKTLNQERTVRPPRGWPCERTA